MYTETTTKADYELVEGETIILSNGSEVTVTSVKEVDGGFMITNDRYGQTFSPTGTRFRVRR